MESVSGKISHIDQIKEKSSEMDHCADSTISANGVGYVAESESHSTRSLGTKTDANHGHSSKSSPGTTTNGICGSDASGQSPTRTTKNGSNELVQRGSASKMDCGDGECTRICEEG